VPRRLQQRVLAQQVEELLGKGFARERPQAGTGTAGQDYGDHAKARKWLGDADGNETVGSARAFSRIAGGLAMLGLCGFQSAPIPAFPRTRGKGPSPSISSAPFRKHQLCSLPQA